MDIIAIGTGLFLSGALALFLAAATLRTLCFALKPRPDIAEFSVRTREPQAHWLREAL